MRQAVVGDFCILPPLSFDAQLLRIKPNRFPIRIDRAALKFNGIGSPGSQLCRRPKADKQQHSTSSLNSHIFFSWVIYLSVGFATVMDHLGTQKEN